QRRAPSHAFLRAAGRQPVAVDDEALRNERALTIPEFCFVENIGKATFYKMKRQGTGPEIHYVPVGGTTLPRISAQARRDWHAKLKAWQVSDAAQLLNERKRAQTSEAGRLAARSPLHISNRNDRRRSRRRR